jgi:hypothetical protein
MKRILTGVFACLMVVAGLMSCQDTLEEQYLDPEKTAEPSIAKFFTKMLDNNRVRAEYWNVRTFLNVHPAVYTQSISFTNTSRRYQQNLAYLDDFWKDYYTPRGEGISGVVAHMREIEKEYATLPAEEKAKADVYLYAAKVTYYDQTAQMVDLWGDIPFSKAGMLNLTGETTASEFESAESIYTALLSGLKEASDYFAAASLDPTVALGFSKQDILLKGSLDKWRRYANSIRLRLLMRISFQNETSAQTEVMEMLNNPATYPLVDEATYDVLLAPLTTYKDFLRNALTELNSHVAPEFLLDGVLKPSGDPRIRVLFDKNVSNKVQNADYYSMPSNLSSTDQEKGIADGKYAVLDSSTYLFNTALPGIVITSAEVNFLKAEAYERWGSTADAQAAYEKAVTQAVAFSFYLNDLGANFRGIENADKEPAVTETEISNLLASAPVAYTGTRAEKLARIWTQKWVSFGFIQSIQSWTELRRTKYPVLSFTPDNTPGSELPPTRLLYPGSEKTYNAANYSKVEAKDNATTRIFWDVQ